MPTTLSVERRVQLAVLALQKRTDLTQRTLTEWHGVDFQKIAKFREGIGIDSGCGEMVNSMRNDPFIGQSCQEFIAQLELAPPLAR